MKKLCTVCLMFVFLGSVAVSSFAGGHCKGGKDKGKYDDSMMDKFYEKVVFIMLHDDELDISDEQYNQIKELKYEVKKGYIKRKSEIDIVKIDIKKELWENTIDTEKINGMIDTKYDLKKEKAKYLVESYANLKNILTDDQKEKMKKIWMGYKKKHEYGK